MPADRVLFVGDDYIDDYVAPTTLGMRAAYYDKTDCTPMQSQDSLTLRNCLKYWNVFN